MWSPDVGISMLVLTVQSVNSQQKLTLFFEIHFTCPEEPGHKNPFTLGPPFPVLPGSGETNQLRHFGLLILKR